MLPTWHDTALQIKFPNHSIGGWGHVDASGLLQVWQCKHPEVASGNCDSASGEIISWVADNCDMIYAIPDYEAGDDVYFHAAILDNGLVYDYTIRQFDTNLAFPWVGSLIRWRQTIERVAYCPSWKISHKFH